MQRTFLFVSVCVIFLLLAGCSKTPPPGLPPLKGCTIRIMDGQTPMSGIAVSLQRKEGQGSWSLGGMTDSAGMAKAKTIIASYEGNGVPTGTYHVWLSEKLDFPKELNRTVDEMMALTGKELESFTAKREAFIKANRRIPDILTDPDKSPLELNVSESGGTLEIDIAKYR